MSWLSGFLAQFTSFIYFQFIHRNIYQAPSAGFGFLMNSWKSKASGARSVVRLRLKFLREKKSARVWSFSNSTNSGGSSEKKRRENESNPQERRVNFAETLFDERHLESRRTFFLESHETYHEIQKANISSLIYEILYLFYFTAEFFIRFLQIFSAPVEDVRHVLFISCYWFMSLFWKRFW